MREKKKRENALPSWGGKIILASRPFLFFIFYYFFYYFYLFIYLFILFEIFKKKISPMNVMKKSTLTPTSYPYPRNLIIRPLSVKESKMSIFT